MSTDFPVFEVLDLLVSFPRAFPCRNLVHSGHGRTGSYLHDCAAPEKRIRRRDPNCAREARVHGALGYLLGILVGIVCSFPDVLL